jgi:hypothetical protein
LKTKNFYFILPDLIKFSLCLSVCLEQALGQAEHETLPMYRWLFLLEEHGLACRLLHSPAQLTFPPETLEPLLLALPAYFPPQEQPPGHAQWLAEASIINLHFESHDENAK